MKIENIFVRYTVKPPFKVSLWSSGFEHWSEETEEI
jgi:hypothetical protein